MHKSAVVNIIGKQLSTHSIIDIFYIYIYVYIRTHIIEASIIFPIDMRILENILTCKFECIKNEKEIK